MTVIHRAVLYRFDCIHLHSIFSASKAVQTVLCFAKSFQLVYRQSINQSINQSANQSANQKLYFTSNFQIVKYANTSEENKMNL